MNTNLHPVSNLQYISKLAECAVFDQHRTKSRVSAFLKRDENIELNVSVTFKFFGNL